MFQKNKWVLLSRRKVDIKHPFCSLQVGILRWEGKLKRQHLEQSVELSRVLAVIMSICEFLTFILYFFKCGFYFFSDPKDMTAL